VTLASVDFASPVLSLDHSEHNMSSAMPTINFGDSKNHLGDEKDVKNAYEDEHVEAASAGDRKGTILSADFGQYINDAAEAVDGQKNQSVIAALKQYRRGVLYSIIFST
jgi:hypothetical protein